mgnify:CR=1 FL=1
MKQTEELAQWLVRALPVLPEDPGFNSQHPHGSSQLPAILGSDTLTETYMQAKHQCTFRKEKKRSRSKVFYAPSWSHS